MNDKILAETKELVERYLDAANNLYGIIPLSKVLSIYNSQNEPLSEEDFLTIVEEIMKKHKYFYVLGEDEFFDDVENTPPIERDVISEYLLIVDEDDYYEMKKKQSGKPYYIPDKKQFLKYEVEDYHEKTLSFISFRAFIRNIPDITKETADEITEDIYLTSRVNGPDTEDALYHITRRNENMFSQSKMPEFISLLNDMYNETRLHANRGFTPREIIQIMCN